MATSHHHHQPLPNSTPPSICRKVFHFLLFLFFTILLSAFVFPSHLIQTNPPKFSISPHQICDKFNDPNPCLSMISEAASDNVIQSDVVDLLRTFLIRSISHIRRAIEAAKVAKGWINNHSDQAALADCLELIDLSIDRVSDSVLALERRTAQSYRDTQTWLSGVLTNYDTCLDGLHMFGKSAMKAHLEDLILRARVALAMLARIVDAEGEMLRPMNGYLPSWIGWTDRRLLRNWDRGIEADVVVAQDGSGDYKTVKEAVEAAPVKSERRFVIHVKRGIYQENVEVGKKKKNVMIVGDGMDLTVITGSLNVVDGSTTFRSATLAAVGDGFILQDIWIQNTAGPEKHQAVALRVGADQAVINRCRIDAYQDTLYAHSNRQFYRDCFITGTVDFIFGNAAVVFQSCKLVARKPMANQKNMVTAQGRTDPDQNTGTSIQNCEIIASSDLEPVQGSFKTYLGRPWKEYSRTVVMQSHIGDLIDPAGWSLWSGDFALETLYYGEYLNRGPGAGTSMRVTWPGYRVITDPTEATKFTVGELIQGGLWLKSSGVDFIEGL